MIQLITAGAVHESDITVERADRLISCNRLIPIRGDNLDQQVWLNPAAIVLVREP